MATDKTPVHKRIQRAEEGRDEWRFKATQRREEIVKLKQELEAKSTNLSMTMHRNAELEALLHVANKKISKQEVLLSNSKKKS